MVIKFSNKIIYADISDVNETIFAIAADINDVTEIIIDTNFLNSLY